MNIRRDAILREMGLAPLWRLRGQEENGVDEAPGLGAAPAGNGEPAAAVAALTVASEDVPAAPASSLASRREASFRHPSRMPAAGATEVVPAPVAMPTPIMAPGDLANLDWDALEARILTCDACVLCKRRKQAVPGVGDRQADWLFVGEGPGAEEDERGEPFVGQAGRLLDNMLATIGLQRGKDVYIANAVKCRPPNNRTPDAVELAACFPYLQRQIELVRPRLIVALGRPAAQALLNEEVRIAASRGKVFDYQGIPVIITYHPAYLLRNLADKAKAWEDLCFARKKMAALRAG